MPTQPIQIFRTGTHIDTAGTRHTFTEAMLAEIAASYDPARHDAPVVVGHPKMDAPAYGWVESLAVQDGVLLATPRDIDAEFAELVNARRFKHVSAAFYPPDDAANPTPGKWSLRHVGFLGAQPPAVKGLKPAQFAAGDQSVCFMEVWQQGVVSRLFRNMREWLIGSSGQEAADRILPSSAIDDIALDMRPTPAAPAFAEPQPTKEKPVPNTDDAAAAQERARLEAERAELASQRAAFAEQQRQARQAEDVTFVEALVREGRVLPANKADTVALLAALSADGEPMVAFSEGGAKHTPHAAMRALLARQPKAVTFGQHSRQSDAAPLADPNDAQDIQAKATAFMEAEAKAGRTVTIAQAVGHVTQGADA